MARDRRRLSVAPQCGASTKIKKLWTDDTRNKLQGRQASGEEKKTVGSGSEKVLHTP